MSDFVQVYRIDDERWVASQDERWIFGVYDSPDTARLACSFSDEQLETLAHIWRHDGEDRPATRTDLDRLIK